MVTGFTDRAKGKVICNVTYTQQGGMFYSSVQDNMTAAAAGTQVAATPIMQMVSRFTIVGAIGASGVLPPALPGAEFTVINAAATNSMSVFAAASQYMNGTLNGSVSVAAGKVANFYCTAAGYWHSLVGN